MNFKPKGIIPPIVTPFDKEGKLNEQEYRKLVRHLMASGVHGLFPLGTTGEFYAVDQYDFEHILNITMEEANGTIPVYAGANSITTKGVIELVKLAEKQNVSAVSVLTPMFISQTQKEIYEFYKTIANSTDLPILMYNNKPKTNVTIEPETVAKLAEIENIVGVKDSTGDMTNTEEYIRLTRTNNNFSVLLGRDTLIYAGLCYGATGAIASCANVAPRLAADIYDKFVAGDFAGALEAQFQLAPLRIACNMGTFPAIIKEGLEMQGFKVGKCLDPIGEITREQKEALSSILSDMALL